MCGTPIWGLRWVQSWELRLPALVMATAVVIWRFFRHKSYDGLMSAGWCRRRRSSVGVVEEELSGTDAPQSEFMNVSFESNFFN
jgi:hypothetical protein